MAPATQARSRGNPLVTELDEYPKGLEALPVEQVNRAVMAHLDPQRMVLIKVGSLMVSPAH